MTQPVEIHLDIETDWHRRLTVIGFESRETGLIQMVGSEISSGRLLRELPSSGRLFTYNGHCFDIVRIRKELRVDLAHHFESCDLRWLCQRNGLVGGQKAIEKRLGFERSGEELDGRDAIRLWEKARSGDEKSLQRLLEYNASDVRGIEAIKLHLRSKGLV
jgi:hypothetical protein